MRMDTALVAVARSAAFLESRSPYLLLDQDLVIRSANDAYLGVTGRTRDELYDNYIFDVFPDNPAVPDADGVRNLSASLAKVLRTGRTSRMWVQRYDIPGPRPEDEFVLKYWSPVSAPVRGDHGGKAVGVVNHVEDVTALWAPLVGHGGAEPDGLGVPDPAEWAKFVAAVANNARVREELVEEVGQLQRALDSRIVIEQAKGIVMAQRRCGPDEAFEVLRRTARSGNLKLHALAAALVEQARRKDQA